MKDRVLFLAFRRPKGDHEFTNRSNVRDRRTFRCEGVGVGALVVGFDCCKMERLGRKVPYLLASADERPGTVNRPVEGSVLASAAWAKEEAVATGPS